MTNRIYHNLYFLIGLAVVNVVALTGFDPLSIGALISFIYIVTAPGVLFLPFLLKNKIAPALAIAIGAALSILLLMLGGLAINTFLPLVGISAPLTTLPFLYLFDGTILILLVLGVIRKKESPFDLPVLTPFSWSAILLSASLPVLACVGAVILNNGGSNAVSMLTLGLTIALVPAIIINRDKVDSIVPPTMLFMMALSFLLMNSMRGWAITGHDILLEYHVFMLVNNAHLWSMSLYQDPYMACLSLTILPTYLQQLLHVNSAYIFKFFLQFVGALPVVAIYYLCKEYVSGLIAFLAGFLYITFPTFMTDMAFLNRQGVAFVFFSFMLYILLNTDHFAPASRVAVLFLFATGMVLSHYSTSYVGIAVLAGAYAIDRIARFAMTATWPRWFARATDLIGNKQGYAAPRLLTLPFVFGVFIIIMIWSVFVTHTSNNLMTTIQQITQNIVRPFSLEQNTGVASYNILQKPATPPPPTDPFQQFVEDSTQQAENATNRSAFYPLSLTSSYSTVVNPEPSVPLTPLGQRLTNTIGRSLGGVYSAIKQGYAKVVQGLLLLGLAGMLIAYKFKRLMIKDPPVEYIALAISGLVILIGQTILPSGSIDYGLLRLFQQNLILLALPTTLALAAIAAIFARTTGGQALIGGAVLLIFFFVLSGMFPQLTGGGRPPLTLDNYGFYYDAYYTHAQEIAASKWFAANGNTALPIQSDRYFSTIKMITYTGIAPLPRLLPETIQKNAYVYLNYNNVKSGEVIEYIGGQVVYYTFPIAFLDNNKNLIYNNGGSEIYR